ncbi:MAG: hypothetical protein GY906_18010 [bacterium]|nr:hypothetical protein [bacterium]
MEEENFRMEPAFSDTPRIQFVKRDPVEPEPVGFIVLMAFRITGYDQDCDGSLMARAEQIDKDGNATGWGSTHIGLHPTSEIVSTLEEWAALFDGETKP